MTNKEDNYEFSPKKATPFMEVCIAFPKLKKGQKAQLLLNRTHVVAEITKGTEIKFTMTENIIKGIDIIEPRIIQSSESELK